MKKILLSLFILLSHTLAHTQEQSPQERKRAITFELGGIGVLYSLGYEKEVLQMKNASLYAGAGLGFWKIDAFHLGLNVQSGALYPISKRGAVDLGIGLSTVHNIGKYGDRFLSRYNDYYFCPRLGYRHDLGKQRKWFFKIAFTPLIDLINREDQLIDRRFYWWGNPFSIGYKF